MFSLLTSYHND